MTHGKSHPRCSLPNCRQLHRSRGFYSKCSPGSFHSAAQGFIKASSPMCPALQPHSLSFFLKPLLQLFLLHHPDRVSLTFIPGDRVTTVCHPQSLPRTTSPQLLQTFPSTGYCLPLATLPSEFRLYHFRDLLVIQDPQRRDNRRQYSL